MAPIKGGYYPSGAENVDIPTQYFTHIIYAFLNPEDGTFQFNIDDDQVARLQTFTATLHAKSPPVKVLFSVGGGTDTAARLLSRMASEQTFRHQFISSSIDVARRLGFDGVDLYWKYPQNPTEMENLGILLEEWHRAVTDDANSTRLPALLLTAAVYYKTTITEPTCTRSYPVSTMSTKLDFINVMTYDYHGRGQHVTSPFAALYDPKSSVSTDAGINSWIGPDHDQMPPEKLIMGLPLCGRTWNLVDPNKTGFGAPAIDNGLMTYAEVVRLNRVNNAKENYDPDTVSVYSVAGNNWISYDDPRSVITKVRYAERHGLGGYFLWEITGDYQWTLSKAGELGQPKEKKRPAKIEKRHSTKSEKEERKKGGKGKGKRRIGFGHPLCRPLTYVLFCSFRFVAVVALCKKFEVLALDL